MKDGKIAIVDEQAELVRSIFRRYLELGGVNKLVRDIKERNIKTKIQHLSSGKTRGGVPFGRGARGRRRKQAKEELAEIQRLLAAFESGLVLQDQNRRAQARERRRSSLERLDAARAAMAQRKDVTRTGTPSILPMAAFM